MKRRTFLRSLLVAPLVALVGKPKVEELAEDLGGFIVPEDKIEDMKKFVDEVTFISGPGHPIQFKIERRLLADGFWRDGNK